MPWFAVVFFGVVVANFAFFYWAGAAALLFFVWLVRPTFRVKGEELQRAEAPALFDELDALHRKLNMPGRMEVRIDGEFNASAAETRGLFGLAGTRRVLTLGVPLLAALSRQELIAVIAHEFGHFSRRHGRLGHWLYRARVGWLRYAEYVAESDSTFNRAAAWYARHFVPYFSARSFVYSRQCEYEADADAAAVVGAQAFAGALTRIAVIGRFWHQVFGRLVLEWQRESPAPPSDFYERFSEAARRGTTSGMQSLLQEAVQERSAASDTHPSLAARLSALDQQPRLAPGGDSAGSALLGAFWPKILAQFDAKWCVEARAGWAVEHFRFRHITRELVGSDAAAAERWPLDRQLERARALRVLDPEAGLGELRRLHERHADDERIAFAYAAALLAEDDAAGLPIMERVIKGNPRFRLPGSQCTLAYFRRQGDEQQIERYVERVRVTRQREARALTDFFDALDGGTAPSTSSLAASGRNVLSDALALQPGVSRAWLLGGSAQLEISIKGTCAAVVVHSLILVLDHAALKAAGDEEDCVAARYEEALASLVPPDELTAVRTFLTTEPVPAVYEQARSAALLLGQATNTS